MKLSGVTCLGVAGVPDGAYDFRRRGGGEALDFVLVTGPAASGKTRLLEAIVAAKERLAPSGLKVRDEDWIARGGRAAKVALTWVFDDEERPPITYQGSQIEVGKRVVEAEVVFGRKPEEHADLEFLLGASTYGPQASRVEYFSSNRRLDLVGPPLSLDAARHPALRVSKDPRKYAFVAPFLRKLAASGEENGFARILGALTDTCELDINSAARGGPELRSRRGGSRSLAELSSSEADAVIFAATATLVGLDRSVVLVDRPELHAGAGDPSRLRGALLGLGEGAQVIAASSSPALVQGVPEECIVRLDPPAG